MIVYPAALCSCQASEKTLGTCMKAVRIRKAQSRLSAFAPHLSAHYTTSQEYPTRSCGLQPQRGSRKYLDLLEILNWVLLVTGEPMLNFAHQSDRQVKFRTRTSIAPPLAGITKYHASAPEWQWNEVEHRHSLDDSPTRKIHIERCNGPASQCLLATCRDIWQT